MSNGLQICHVVILGISGTDPPWQQREWVTSPQGRKTYIGFELDCKTCGSPDVE